MPKGTRDWAGGDTDFSTPHTMWVRDVKIENYSPAASYTYTDTSGTMGSVKAIGGALMSSPGSSGASNPPPPPAIDVVSDIEATSVLAAVPAPHETTVAAAVPQIVSSTTLAVQTFAPDIIQTPTTAARIALSSSSTSSFHSVSNSTTTSAPPKTSSSPPTQKNNTATATATGKNEASQFAPESMLLFGLLSTVVLFAFF
jgi:hypothetical protein